MDSNSVFWEAILGQLLMAIHGFTTIMWTILLNIYDDNLLKHELYYMIGLYSEEEEDERR